jgi:hypothetical protein
MHKIGRAGDTFGGDAVRLHQALMHKIGRRATPSAAMQFGCIRPVVAPARLVDRPARRATRMATGHR